MATTPQPPEAVGLRTSGRLHAAGTGSPAAQQADAIRQAAAGFRHRFGEQAPIHSVVAVDGVGIPAPARLLLRSPLAAAGAWVLLIGRMLIIRFDDFDGARRTLIWEPLIAEAISEACLYANRADRPIAGMRGGRPRQLCSVQAALARSGLGLDAVDFVGFGDLRGHDLRRVTGTVRPLADSHQPRAPLFQGARLLVQADELEAARSPHPLHASWYVPGAVDDLIDEPLIALDGDVALGPGVALLATPGITPGHQSLVMRTQEGIWVVSSNGVAVECWQPLLSKIPGVRRGAETDGLEVMLPAAGTPDPRDLYSSMVLERSLAHASREDPRWLLIFPQRELAARARQWPLLPTYSHAPLRSGS